MARAGFVARFLKPCAVAAFLAVVAACGGGGGSPAPEVVRITLAGLPGTPMAPMQTAPLVASATYSDGAVQDVSGAAVWDSTDRDVIDVSPAGLATATGPGKANVSAAYAGVRGTVTAEVIALPSAYVIDGVEYAFDYRLDAQGRVDNYRISRRDGVSYPTAPTADPNPRECMGSLRGSYVCTIANAFGGYYRYAMTGEQGRLVAMLGAPSLSGFGESSFKYVYGSAGLSQFGEQWLSGGMHNRPTLTSALSYDGRGRLGEVRTTCVNMVQGYSASMEKTARIETDSLGRLLREDVTTVVIDDPYTGVKASCPADIVAWTYDAAGIMKTAGSTEYTADAAGWLTSRRRVEGANTVVDTYAVSRFRGRVAEEQFTQAEPRAFYTSRSDLQRVRYEWGRLPVEPLFVPRALTGLEGADYLGIISSHHRESGYVIPTP